MSHGAHHADVGAVEMTGVLAERIASAMQILAVPSRVWARVVDTRGPALLRVADLVLLPIANGRITVAGIIPRPGRSITRHLHLPWRDRSPAPSLDWPSIALLIEQPVTAANQTAGYSLVRLPPAQIADLIGLAGSDRP